VSTLPDSLSLSVNLLFLFRLHIISGVILQRHLSYSISRSITILLTVLFAYSLSLYPLSLPLILCSPPPLSVTSAYWASLTCVSDPHCRPVLYLPGCLPEFPLLFLSSLYCHRIDLPYYYPRDRTYRRTSFFAACLYSFLRSPICDFLLSISHVLLARFYSRLRPRLSYFFATRKTLVVISPVVDQITLLFSRSEPVFSILSHGRSSLSTWLHSSLIDIVPPLTVVDAWISGFTFFCCVVLLGISFLERRRSHGI